jgi:hypothetical protein
MFDPALVVKPPHFNEHKISPWIDEQIWGHRLWDSQSAWLLFLEFLTVAEARQRDGHLLEDGQNCGPIAFHPAKRMHLRNILFNSDDLIPIDEKYPDSNSAWKRWLESMEERAIGVGGARDFAYLRSRFHSYHDFAGIIALLRSETIESGSNRRWTSRFIFPFGPNAIYEDQISTASGQVSRDYINFGRTGELLYLMLSRSTSNAELVPELNRLFVPEGPWNSLVGLFEPSLEPLRETRGQSYLPYKSHLEFDRLGEDWLEILHLDVPPYDKYPHLVTMGALHVLLYQLQTSVQSLDLATNVTMTCEIVAPKKTLVRELSAESYLRNTLLPAQAVTHYVEQIAKSPDWLAALDQPDAFVQCRRILQEKVNWGEDDRDYDGNHEPSSLLAALKTIALSGHKQHAANIHRSYGRDVGLVSKRGTNKLRYAPNDNLLKTLLLANVKDRMELSEFLQTLYGRYGLVIGDKQAEQVLPPEQFDKKAFQANAKRLEGRLGSLGMLRRLSDGCAYVENPYRQAKHE